MRRFPAFRPVYRVIALVTLPILAWLAYGYVQRRNQSPFVLWDLRAGMKFGKVERIARRHGTGRFICQVAIEPARLCTLRVAGIPGLVRVLVDGRGRAAIVQFLPDTASPRMREEGRQVAARWNLVRQGAADKPPTDRRKPSTTRWSSDDKRWSALSRYGIRDGTPALELREEPAVRKILSSAPLAPLVLVMSELIAPHEVSNLEELSGRLRPALVGNPTNASDETPAPPAINSSAPICQPAPDLVEPNADAGADTTENTLLSEVLARVYPGSRLVFGEGMWLIESTGRTERLVIRRSGFGDVAERGTRLYKTFFPTRYRLAEERMRSGRSEVFCRAPGHVLFVRTAEEGALMDVKVVPVDHEALATDITTITVIPGVSTGGVPHLRVRYTAAYGSPRWSGSLDWETIIANDPPRSTVRVPLRFEQRAHDSTDIQSGMLVVLRRSHDAIELATLEQYGHDYVTRSVRVPVDSSGVLFGARLLAALQR